VTLQQRVRAYMGEHQLVGAGQRVGVAVSGGADSVALLLLLIELREEAGLVLSVVHFNHCIRGAAADADQEFVRVLAERLDLPVHLGGGDAPAHAKAKRLGLETAARDLRHAYFRELLGSGGLDRIATGHTLDDQAETVLLRLIRGAGTRGLAGIYPQRNSIVRPLLACGHGELEEYLRAQGQEWREDATNRDLRHLRNRVRHLLLPMLEREFNPGIRNVLAGMAEVARGEEEYWERQCASAEADVLHSAVPESGLHILADGLRSLPPALQRRLLHRALRRFGAGFGHEHVEQLLQLTAAANGSKVELPLGRAAQRHARCPARRAAGGPELVIGLQSAASQGGYEYALPASGRIFIPETGKFLSASWERGAGGGLRVRNWRPGDRFWPAHARSPRKVKELLAQRHVSGVERQFWPVVVDSKGKLIWMRDLGMAQPLADKSGSVCIQEE
jgi:tRNA(Ile)-lysidine synthase